MARTSATTRAEAQSHRRRRPSLAHGAVCLLTGLLLCALAWPRLMAALEAAPADHVLWQINENGKAGKADLDGASRALAAALRRHESAGHWGARGHLLLLQGTQQGFGETPPAIAPALLVSSHRRSLAFDPADPYVWLRLAQSHIVQAGANAAAASAVSRALRLAPADRAVRYRRLDLGFLLWPHLDEADRAVLRDDIRAMAWHDVKWLIAVTLRRHALAVTRAALAETPDRLQEFDRFYREELY